jgi:hypothetical protein
MRKRTIIVLIGSLSLAAALFCSRETPAAERGQPTSVERAPQAQDSAPISESQGSSRSGRPTSVRDGRTQLLRRAALAALQSTAGPAEEAARRELAALERQRAENITAILRPPMRQKPLDPNTLSRADELLTAYARERKQLLAEMYDGYLKLGPLYDPTRHLRAIDDAAADFAAEAEQLEREVPGITVLGEMLEATSLKRPSFLEELHARDDDKGV